MRSNGTTHLGNDTFVHIVNNSESEIYLFTPSFETEDQVAALALNRRIRIHVRSTSDADVIERETETDNKVNTNVKEDRKNVDNEKSKNSVINRSATNNKSSSNNNNNNDNAESIIDEKECSESDRESRNSSEDNEINNDDKDANQEVLPSHVCLAAPDGQSLLIINQHSTRFHYFIDFTRSPALVSEFRTSVPVRRAYWNPMLGKTFLSASSSSSSLSSKFSHEALIKQRRLVWLLLDDNKLIYIDTTDSYVGIMWSLIANLTTPHLSLALCIKQYLEEVKEKRYAKMSNAEFVRRPLHGGKYTDVYELPNTITNQILSSSKSEEQRLPPPPPHHHNKPLLLENTKHKNDTNNNNNGNSNNNNNNEKNEWKAIDERTPEKIDINTEEIVCTREGKSEQNEVNKADVEINPFNNKNSAKSQQAKDRKTQKYNESTLHTTEQQQQQQQDRYLDAFGFPDMRKQKESQKKQDVVNEKEKKNDETKTNAFMNKTAELAKEVMTKVSNNINNTEDVSATAAQRKPREELQLTQYKYSDQLQHHSPGEHEREHLTNTAATHVINDTNNNFDSSCNVVDMCFVTPTIALQTPIVLALTEDGEIFAIQLCCEPTKNSSNNNNDNNNNNNSNKDSLFTETSEKQFTPAVRRIYKKVTQSNEHEYGPVPLFIKETVLDESTGLHVVIIIYNNGIIRGLYLSESEILVCVDHSQMLTKFHNGNKNALVILRHEKGNTIKNSNDKSSERLESVRHTFSLRISLSSGIDCTADNVSVNMEKNILVVSYYEQSQEQGNESDIYMIAFPTWDNVRNGWTYYHSDTDLEVENVLLPIVSCDSAIPEPLSFCVPFHCNNNESISIGNLYFNIVPHDKIKECKVMETQNTEWRSKRLHQQHAAAAIAASSTMTHNTSLQSRKAAPFNGIAIKIVTLIKSALLAKYTSFTCESTSNDDASDKVKVNSRGAHTNTTNITNLLSSMAETHYEWLCNGMLNEDVGLEALTEQASYVLDQVELEKEENAARLDMLTERFDKLKEKENRLDHHIAQCEATLLDGIVYRNGPSAIFSANEKLGQIHKILCKLESEQAKNKDEVNDDDNNNNNDEGKE